ncbi:hypothetical protein LOZ61_001739 [Ophidiomyces ophidiicola]|nr:hypothetical protein LOZ61_001739 [Ophidiomyces ophidiicola]KAI1925483.1 hypothetical protein LOZ60_004138 [Ophidiomyces ophidiicola]KAI2149012.1 hypothetical protein LOZ27_001149 [Ophidiomyces ophidiicola]KAI2237871.1 hypothetical protein LOZ13_004099 [Ophidiomyces ophidiicola]KAI2267200.1 hypothetical protein LOZ10_001533 [Ophidiomyces ophidiicola]
MVQIVPFAVEQWMDEYETTATYNIAETCCAPLSLDDLCALAPEAPQTPFSTATKLTYGAIRGSNELRSNLARLLYTAPPGDESSSSSSSRASLPPENILITPGAINANFLLLYTLIQPGDHVICHYPTYQQLYSVPSSLGAEVSLWKTRSDDGWRLCLDELKALIRPNTKMIIIKLVLLGLPPLVFLANPTGALIAADILAGIVDIARQHSLLLHSDEVYRPLFHGLADRHEWPPSVLSFGYDKAIATGSMSKVYSLAGIRVGWIASASTALVERCASARDYTTISVSQVDDGIAAFALDPCRVERLVQRNLGLARTNLAILKEFVDEHRGTCDWVEPRAGTTAFVRFSRPLDDDDDDDGRRRRSAVDDVALCTMLQREKGVMFVPGSRCFGDEFRGYVRIGYVQETAVLQAGLRELRAFMTERFDSVPVV